MTTLKPKQMQKIAIAIDPDVDKSGVAVWNENEEIKLSIYNFDFFDLINTFQCLDCKEHIVIVEAGWLNKSNWHKKKGMTTAAASKIGEKIGANHQIGKMIVELSRNFKIQVIEQKPLAKIWNTSSKKISHAELDYFVDGLPKQTNQEQRDAILLLWNYLKNPIKKMLK